MSLYEQRQYVFPLFPFAFPLQPKRVDRSWRTVDLPIEDDFTASGHALTIAWELAPSVSLKSISAYRELDVDQLHDTVEAFNLPAVNRHDAGQHQFSQELLLSGALNGTAIQYHVGGFYFTETGRQQEQSLANPFGMAFASPYVPPTIADLGPAVASSAENESIGIYADVSWTPRTLDALTLNAGGRYSRDTRDAERVGSPAADTDYSRFDPSFTVDYRWTDELHTYARYATAYRAGGFNLLNSNLSPFEPEKLTSYELGLKAQWLDRRLRTNLAAFWQTYEDMQLDFIDPATQQVYTLNAGEATFDGVEGEFEFLPADALRIISGRHVHVRATKRRDHQPIHAGARVRDVAAERAGSGSTTPASSTGSRPRASAPSRCSWATASGTAGRTSNGGPGSAGDPRPSYDLVNARLALSDIGLGRGRLSLALWGKQSWQTTKHQYYHYLRGGHHRPAPQLRHQHGLQL